jgi:signal transduction histidine kinase/CheY-like chemotaxis protein
MRATLPHPSAGHRQSRLAPLLAPLLVPLLIPLLILLLSGAAAALLVLESEHNRLQLERTRASDLAGDYAHAVARAMDRALAAPHVLQAFIQRDRGRFSDFDAIARKLLPTIPGAAELQLAPNGVVSAVVPLEGNEAVIGHDVLHDALRGPQAQRTRELGTLQLAGPFELKQGGTGAVGRLPVFLNNGHGQHDFWGFANVVLRFPAAIASARLERLAARGYDYALSAVNPENGATVLIARSSEQALRQPVARTITVANTQWQLEVAPSAGWDDTPQLALRIILSAVACLMLAYMASLLLQLRRHKRGLQQEVSLRTAELAEASRAKSDFLAQVSHDLRSPLSAILGYADALGRDAELAGRARDVNVIRHSARHLMGMIDDLLDFARSHASTATLRPAPVYLHALLSDLMLQAEAMSSGQGNRVALDADSTLPQVIVCDALRLRQVLLNLLSNAVKFTRGGEVRLQVRVLSRQDGTPALEFAVADTGAGIDSAELDSIFEPFHRAEAQRGVPGTGLGLAICRRWVGAMGGALSVHSEVGVGSRFSFHIPVTLADEAQVEAGVQAAAGTAASGPRGGAHCVLLVEDVAQVRQSLHALLVSHGYRVLCAVNGRDALARLAAHGEPPDAVITDQAMPEMDGWALLLALREGLGADLPVLLLSATPPQPPAGWPAALTFSSQLLKPADAPLLLGELARLLRSTGRAEPASTVASGAPTAATPGDAARPPADANALLPPSRHLREFQDWAELGALSMVETHATLLAARHPEYAPFAHWLLERADELDLEAIAARCALALADAQPD